MYISGVGTKSGNKFLTTRQRRLTGQTDLQHTATVLQALSVFHVTNEGVILYVL